MKANQRRNDDDALALVQPGFGDGDHASVDCISLTLWWSPSEGLELLYQPEAVRLYLSLLTCSQNHNTLEAAAGALQNLAAGQWAVSGWTLSHNEIFICILLLFSPKD